ncbi:MAG: spermidine synthase, partial [Desulfuromonadales bacterium]|nr:spermidine synthase [Desulfuromonadales bacterium]
DAIVFDLYKGPHYHTHKIKDPLYGSRAIDNVKAALNPGGMFSIWGENYDESFDKRLCAAGFTVSHERPGRGGFRHVVFLAKLPLSRTKQSLTHRKN